MAYAIVFFLLFLLPFVVLPFGTNPFEIPKVIITEVGIFLFLILTFTSIRLHQLVREKERYILFITLFLLSLLHIIFRNSDILFFGNTFRMQGIFLFWLLLAFSVLSAKIQLKGVAKGVILFLLFANLFFGIFISGNNEERAIGTIGEPNAFAASLLFLWPFLFIEKKITKKILLLQIAGVIITGLIILATGSRSGMVTFGVQMVLLFLNHFLNFPRGRATIITCILFLASLTLPFLDKTTIYERRDDIWKAALIAGYEHPIIGWGFGNTEKALEKYNDKLYNTAHGYYVDSSHNVFLDIWIQGGFVGLLVFLLLLYDAIKVFAKKNTPVYVVLLLGLISAMSFNPVSVVTLVQLWWLIGQSLSQVRKEP